MDQNSSLNTKAEKKKEIKENIVKKCEFSMWSPFIWIDQITLLNILKTAPFSHQVLHSVYLMSTCVMDKFNNHEHQVLSPKVRENENGRHYSFIWASLQHEIPCFYNPSQLRLLAVHSFSHGC